MKYAYFVYFMVLVSCNESAKSVKNSANEADLISTVKTAEDRFFDEREKLFMNFYNGMTQTELYRAASKSLNSKRLVYIKEIYPFGDHPIYNENDLLLKDTIIQPNQINSYFHKLSYPLVIEGKTYFMSMREGYEDGYINGLNLSGPLVNKSYERKSNIFRNEMRLFKKQILQLYTKKYGKPNIEPYVEVNPVWDKLFKDGKEDLNRYIFKSDVLAIVFYESGRSSYDIKYMTLENFNREQLLRETSKENKEQKLLESEKSTYSDI